MLGRLVLSTVAVIAKDLLSKTFREPSLHKCRRHLLCTKRGGQQNNCYTGRQSYVGDQDNDDNRCTCLPFSLGMHFIQSKQANWSDEHDCEGVSPRKADWVQTERMMTRETRKRLCRHGQSSVNLVKMIEEARGTQLVDQDQCWVHALSCPQTLNCFSPFLVASHLPFFGGSSHFLLLNYISVHESERVWVSNSLEQI